jgi:pilus assembly protein Flp/PilA
MDIIGFWEQMVEPWIRARVRSERGAALVEYALLLALIAVVCIVALDFLGDEAAEKFSDVGNSIAATRPAGWRRPGREERAARPAPLRVGPPAGGRCRAS